MHEIFRRRMDAMRCWPRERPGLTIRGSYLGSLVLTNQRLLFLSTGGSRWLNRVLEAATGSFLGALAVGKALTEDLDMGILGNAGRLEIPLIQILRCQAKRRWDFGAYLTVRWSEGGWRQRVASWMTEFGVKMATLREMEQEIHLARNEALARLSYGMNDSPNGQGGGRGA